LGLVFPDALRRGIASGVERVASSERFLVAARSINGIVMPLSDDRIPDVRSPRLSRRSVAMP
jgi:hypothetical protein